MGGKKEHDEDWEAPCEKDDEECWEDLKEEFEERRFKAKKGGKGHKGPKHHDEDWEAPCEKDDEECWGEFEDLMKAAFEECGEDKECWEELKPEEERRFKAKKGGKGHKGKKEHDEDWEAPCEEDDEECWGEFEDLMKAAFEECGEDKECWEELKPEEERRFKAKKGGK